MQTIADASTMAMMVPWLHFSGGDYLLFKSWHPTSASAIAGACIGLAVFAIFERWVNGVRGALGHRWRSRALVLMSPSEETVDGPKPPTPPMQLKTPSLDYVEEVRVASVPPRLPQQTHRTLPPFIASHDIPRGALFAFQALLYYILMMVVMTFQAAYLMSIIVGLAIGEVLFGRGAKPSMVH